MNRPDYIIIHHSATQDSGTVSWGAIRHYHTRTLGWQNVGYHAGIELVGEHYEILLGRFPEQSGAHVKELGMNRRSLGVCLVGDFDHQEPWVGQVQLARDLVRSWMLRYSIPRQNVLGHREVGLMAGLDWRKGPHVYKSCPGKLFDMDDFRLML